MICCRFFSFILFFFIWTEVLWSNPLLTAAGNALSKGKLKQAEFLFKQAEKQGVSSIIVNYNLAYIYFKQENVYKAEIFYNKVIEAAPLSADAHQNLARVYYYYQDIQKAIVVLEDFLSKVTNDYDTHLLLGDLCREIEAYDQAEKQYFIAVRLNPISEEAYLAMVDLYLLLNDDERALGYIEEAKEMIYGNIPLLEKESVIYQRLGKYLEASITYEQMIKLSTNITKEDRYLMKYELANIYLDGEFYFLAARELKIMIEDHPEKKEAIKLLGYIYNITDRQEKAFDLYKEVYPFNKKIAYLGMKNIFAKAVNEDNSELIKSIMVFYDKHNIKDQVYQLAKK